MPTIRINRWSGKHEVSQSRKVNGELSWVAVPVRQGRGYCLLTAKHGAKGLGVWVALLELVANQHKDDRGALVACWEDAAMMARLPISEVLEVAPTLMQLGWVEYEEDGPQTPEIQPATSALPEKEERATTVLYAQDGTGRNGTEEKDISSDSKRTSGTTFDERQDRNGRLTIPEAIEVWNDIAAEYGVPRTLKPSKKIQAGVRSMLTDLGEFGTEPVVGRAFILFAKQEFIQQKRYGLGNFLPNRDKYLPEAIERVSSGT